MESNLKYFFRDNLWTTTQFLADACTRNWGIFALVESNDSSQLREFFVEKFFPGNKMNGHQIAIR